MNESKIATGAQIHHIEYLAIELQYARVSRQWQIELLLGRNVKYLDELTTAEASKVITNFKERKEELKARESDYDPSEDYLK